MILRSALCIRCRISVDFELSFTFFLIIFVIFIFRMARGVDIWVAQIVLREWTKNPVNHLVVAVPYKGVERRWQLNFIFQYADLVKYICPIYSHNCFQRRNERMANRFASVIAVYNGSIR